MFLWYPVLDLARATRRNARKKGSGYENALAVNQSQTTKIIEYNYSQRSAKIQLVKKKRLKADFQSSHEAPRSSLQVHASN